MSYRREQAWVGAFVLVAAAVLVAVVLAASGTFTTKGTAYRTYFRYAAGVGPGAPVRYGGLLAGKVESLRVDPLEPGRIEVRFRVRHDIPVKTDSIARITSLGALGESYVEVSAGKKEAPRAPAGSAIPSHETLALADLGDMIGSVVPQAEAVLKSLNDRLEEIKTTIAQTNDLLGEPNRKHIAGSLAELNTMLADARPKVAATLSNTQAATERLQPVIRNAEAASERVTPVLDDLQKTVRQANDTLAHVDSMLAENRPDIRATMQELRKTTESAAKAVELLRAMMDRNAENLDEALTNVRASTQNLQELTDTLKRKPSVLIRGETGKDRQPGSTQ